LNKKQSRNVKVKGEFDNRKALSGLRNAARDGSGREKSSDAVKGYWRKHAE